MILVIGGIASGKRTYIRSLGYADKDMDPDPGSIAPVLLNLEESLRPGELTQSQLDMISRKNVISCCEVGQGVVPLAADERVWREAVGRTCAILATRAERVIRMVCGIPTVIK